MNYLPNLLTSSRFLAAIFTAWALLEKDTALATLFLAWAAVSDVLDGWLARRLRATSAFGATLDLLADKFLVFLLLAILLWLNPGLWLGCLLLLTVLREGLMARLRQGRVIAAKSWGKLKTFLQFSGLFLLLWPVTFAVGLGVFSVATAVGFWSLWRYWQGARLTK
jgi:CDP-diacylglycerol--glycerol-3-phosphate 3-phosphatidyltransferase